MLLVKILQFKQKCIIEEKRYEKYGNDNDSHYVVFGITKKRSVEGFLKYNRDAN